MKTSARGIELIKQFEGLELEAYQDIAGIWTIGYGHTGPDVEPGMRISEREAEALLRKDLTPRENAVSNLTSVGLNQNEFDALVSFVYNVGIDAYRRSTARRRLNSGDRVGAADALTWWNKATVGGVLREVAGLTRRRAAERALFLTPVNPIIVRDQENINENSRITPIEDSPRRGSLLESRSVQGATVAGGAGAAAATMGRDSAEELDELETNIESGVGLTVDSSTGAEPTNETEDETAADATDSDAAADAAGEDEANVDAAGDTSGAVNALPGESDVDDQPDADGDTDGVVAETEDGAVISGEGAESSMEQGEVVVSEMPQRPSKREVHAVEAQVQFALLVLVLLAVAFVIFARIDDWMNFRR